MDTLSVVEIVDETVKFYSEDVDRRAVVGGACQYTTPDGRHCAVGRCLIDESFIGNKGGTGPSGGIDEHWPEDEDLNEALKPQYRGQSIYFWIDLQHLHDSEQLWDANGLNVGGQEVADKLIRDHA